MSVEVSGMSGGWVPREVNLPGKTQRVLYVLALEVKIVILQEGPTPIPRCSHCWMHIPEARM